MDDKKKGENFQELGTDTKVWGMQEIVTHSIILSHSMSFEAYKPMNGMGNGWSY